MAIPDFQSLTLPTLFHHSDGKIHRIQDTREALAAEFKLTLEERKKLLPSGRQPIFNNRVAWAFVYLKQAGLLSSMARGVYQITELGSQIAKSPPRRIDIAFLSQFEAVRAFRKGRTAESNEIGQPQTSTAEAETPEETIDEAYEVLRNALASELIDRLKGCSPAFFEWVVLEVLKAMGYGGDDDAAIEATGRSGDGGVDGIIKEDKLGLDIICVQAKRWENPVGSAVIREFAGSMEAVRARKGVIITTSRFTNDARDYTTKIERKIVLIDGERLARLMIDHNVGVSDSRAIVLKRIDSDFFEESAA